MSRFVVIAVVILGVTAAFAIESCIGDSCQDHEDEAEVLLQTPVSAKQGKDLFVEDSKRINLNETMKGVSLTYPSMSSKGAAGGGTSCNTPGSTPSRKDSKFGNGCIWSDEHCVNKYNQCGIKESDAAAVCGAWDECAGVICKKAYGGYCLARNKMDPSATTSGMWAYTKMDKVKYCSHGVVGTQNQGRDKVVCCAKSCGKCGGTGCEKRPGGLECCAGTHTKKAAPPCATAEQVGCLMPKGASLLEEGEAEEAEADEDELTFAEAD